MYFFQVLKICPCTLSVHWKRGLDLTNYRRLKYIQIHMSAPTDFANTSVLWTYTSQTLKFCNPFFALLYILHFCLCQADPSPGLYLFCSITTDNSLKSHAWFTRHWQMLFSCNSQWQSALLRSPCWMLLQGYIYLVQS